MHKPHKYVAMAQKIQGKVGKKLSKKHSMDFFGVRSGMMEQVNMLGLLLEIRHPLDREEARKLIIDSVEELLAAVNDNKEIRPYLKNYPFTTKNVSISIFSSHSDGREVFDPYISDVTIHESDVIEFSTKEPNKRGYKNQWRESYSEALARLRGKTQAFSKPISKSVTTASTDPSMQVN